MLKSFMAGSLPVEIYNSRAEMGEAAAKYAAQRLSEIISAKGEAAVVFAAAPSQNEFLQNLLLADIDWGKVTAFHMDEYIGLQKEHKAGFANFLDDAVWSRREFKAVNKIDGLADPAQECKRYSGLLEATLPDMVFLGVGENGHLAFNDPPVADFNDPEAVKVVELDDICRNQQVNDGCFSSIGEVPKKALTLTMSMLMKIPHAVVVVPAKTKRSAVKTMIDGEIATSCPASILRTHKSAKLFCDRDSGADFI